MRRALPAFDVPARGQLPETELIVTEGLQRRRPIEALTEKILTAMMKAPELNELEQRALRDALAVRLEIDENEAALIRLKEDLDAANKDIQRLREHLSAFGEAPGAEARPIVSRLMTVEDRLDELQRTRVALTQRRVDLTAAMHASFAGLAGD